MDDLISENFKEVNESLLFIMFMYFSECSFLRKLSVFQTNIQEFKTSNGVLPKYVLFCCKYSYFFNVLALSQIF